MWCCSAIKAVSVCVRLSWAVLPSLLPQDLEQREAVRAAAAKNVQWQAFIDASRPHVAKQVGTLVTRVCRGFVTEPQRLHRTWASNCVHLSAHTTLYPLVQLLHMV